MHPDQHVAESGLEHIREQLHAVGALAAGVGSTQERELQQLVSDATDVWGQLAWLFDAVEGDRPLRPDQLKLLTHSLQGVGDLVSRTVTAIDRMRDHAVSEETQRALNDHLRAIYAGTSNLQSGVVAAVARLLARGVQ